MKHIAKNEEPPELREFNTKANPNWQPSFDGMSGNLKRALHDTLLNEQGWICCYCNRRVGRDSSHIEHVRPRSRYPEEEASYGNLLASCQREEQRGEPLHCGASKADWYDDGLFVSPLQPDCETRFRYTGDGGIYPVQQSDRAALETLQRLRLDIPKLRRLREGAIDAFMDSSLTPQDLRYLSEALLQRDAAGMFPEFCVAVVCVLGGLPP